jgi:hypothetical protein
MTVSYPSCDCFILFNVSQYCEALGLLSYSVLEDGISFAESCVVLKWLEDAGVDFFDISGGTYASPVWRGSQTSGFPETASQKAHGR